MATAVREISHFIGNVATAGTGTRRSDVFDPNTGKVQAQVTLGAQADLDAAMTRIAGAAPQAGWSTTAPSAPVR